MKLLVATFFACVIAILFNTLFSPKTTTDNQEDNNVLLYTVAVGLLTFTLIYITYDMLAGKDKVVEMMRHIETGEPTF
jgi:hypothetical protein